MEQTDIDNNDISVKTKKANRRVGHLSLIGVVVGISLFSSGWLFGSGRLSVSSAGTLPGIERSSKAPDEGLDELYSQIVSNYDGEVDKDKLLIGLKEGLTESVGDPFTEYLSEDEVKEFNEGLNGTFEGIGAELGKENNLVVIVAPIKGTPADKAGLQPQDAIIEINGEDSTNISITEAVSRIRGPKGETVKLTLARDGEKVEVEIIRDTITIDSVESKMDGDIGILTISRFGDDTVPLARKAATDLVSKGAKSIILDLRGNPGGLLTAAVDISGIWLEKGKTVLEEKQDGVIVQSYNSAGPATLNGMPTVVMINKGSASASEIVAGALRDNNAATLVGETSYGKGSVQRLIPLSFGGSLKVTIARWFTPSGGSIDKEGIKPDETIELTTEDREAKRDPQLDKAKELLKQ